MASSLTWPAKCSVCNGKVKEEADAYAVWKCRQDHYFICCVVDCQRVFDKRCSKVMDSIEKRERKINNEGQMNALRRLPAAEREKLKQKAEAELHNDWLICPEEVKASERSVPFCAFCMTKIAGHGEAQKRVTSKDADDGDVPGPPPLPPRSPANSIDASPTAAASNGLVDDDMLVVLKKDDGGADEGEDNIPSKKKGKGKKGKEKKGQMLLLGYEPYRQADPEQEVAASQVSAWAGGRPGQAKEAAAPQKAQPPSFLAQERATKVQQLVDTTGCTEQRAKELLERHHWIISQAADAFFDDRPSPTGGRNGSGGVDASPTANSSVPRWGPRQGVQPSPEPQPRERREQPREQQQQQQQPQAAASPGAASAAADSQQQLPEQQDASPVAAASLDSPALPPPQQPPPPCLPPGWRAVWNEEQQAHYYWHVPANYVTWERPVGAEEEASARRKRVEEERLAAERRAAEEEEEKEKQKQEAERRAAERRAAEQRAAEQRAEEQRRAEEAESIRRQNLVVEAAHITGADEDRCRAKLAAEGWDLEAVVKMLAVEQDMDRRRQQQQEQAAKAQRQEQHLQPPREKLCTRHWRPLPNVQNAMPILQGERVQVSWTDGSPGGWAWGHTVEDPAREGYFPQAILEPVTREPRGRAAGETCGISGRFEAPQEIGGYLSVAPGDAVQVLHPIDKPYVWAYAKRISSNGEFDQDGSPCLGWLPEVVLCDVDARPAG